MKFRLTRPALRDLAEIGRYTRELWGKEQARDYGSAMTVRLKWLSRNEPLWHERPELDAVRGVVVAGGVPRGPRPDRRHPEAPAQPGHRDAHGDRRRLWRQE